MTSVVGKSWTSTSLTSFGYTYISGANDPILTQTAYRERRIGIKHVHVLVRRNGWPHGRIGDERKWHRLSGYAFDADGDLLSRTAGSITTTYAYNGGDGELCWAYTGTSTNTCATTPTGATTYSFDANGNETGNSAGSSFSCNSKTRRHQLHPGEQHSLSDRLFGHRSTAAYRRGLDDLRQRWRRRR